ncbi:HAMP domain-containing sensor histidine kinase [Zwartia sp.]|uniref:sensor histidine kinase n=1 Tax=Zwartia sp. TaxID=2978004 RepID=UPI0027194F7F|nr:HAMP domain-containing sensor histidine kinase [Zwartia sp.]MDO9023796.1 HAMP domain-containing sensor histidine kinase [Zwartia sp.]
MSLAAPGSLARLLIKRLLPPIITLVLLDLAATWFVSHKLDSKDWQLEDVFWLMALGQSVLIGLLIWVVVSGVNRSMTSVHALSEQIAQRSAEDLGRMELQDLPSEFENLLTHTNALFARLSDTFEAQRGFVGHASHQLKTPLAGLKLECELMLAQPLPPDIRERAERIKSVTDRMIRMGTQLLLLARVDPEGRPQDHFVLLDLCEWVRTCGAEWFERAQHRNIELVLEAPDQPVWIEGDPILLKELLANLIDNALRYAQGARRIRLHVTATPPTLSVEDDGCGIALKDQSRVFDAFYRASGAAEGGSGLGMALVREIARAHGAWWNLVSTPQIAGARITILFPGMRKGAQLSRMERLSRL